MARRRNPDEQAINNYVEGVLEYLQDLEEMGGPDIKTYLLIMARLQIAISQRINNALDQVKE